MEPLNKNSKCPRCDGRMIARKDVIGDLDTPIIACMKCKIYGVQGDDRVFDRKDFDDEELVGKLRIRAVKLIEFEKQAQKRYTDAPEGRVWHK